MVRKLALRLGMAMLAVSATTAFAQEGQGSDGGQSQVQMSPAELFAFADAARDRGDYATAEQAYRALTGHPEPSLRNEARFRLARMYADQMGRYADAAVLLRAILDEQPEASPVRLELARVLGQLGDFSGARRELRAVQTDTLPPEVQQVVRFYANALDAAKPYGASFEIAFAPSTNINRATGNETLETVIGDFTLSEDAQAKSGVGLSGKAQVYGRLPLGERAQVLARISADADIYRQKDFNDIALTAQVGPELRSGSDRIALAATATYRWFGMEPYSFSYGLTGNFRHPLSPTSQLRVDATALREENERNTLQSGERYVLSIGLDKAFDQKTGGGLRLNGSRFVAGDPGFSLASGGISAFAYRELGRTTAVLNIGYSRLEADRRIFLYPQRRKDDRLTTSLSGTFRQLTFGRFAPLLRVRYDRNWSTVGIYDFSSLSGEVGVTAAF
ncbi:surface lipoprotein assembly modifier [Paraurantiacibacter namhicola]|uniref:TPR repeat-containing protein n=1 Tax=Paraurantiacibacter namhicola TaxID=645517 RepID=A0A1C7D864_9SPHN|nr:surface lipoprotein assembly modifier [Paraurantiacibacter namhicola]ANU07664.1 TPR repeat-containing protein precursor [Paraurantiacibacter namhicola]